MDTFLCIASKRDQRAYAQRDVPADVREQMTFHPVMTVGEVLDIALEPASVRPEITA